MSELRMMTARAFLRGGYRLTTEPTVVIVTIDGEPRPLGTWVPAGFEEPGTKAGPPNTTTPAAIVVDTSYSTARPAPKGKR